MRYVTTPFVATLLLAAACSGSERMPLLKTLAQKPQPACDGAEWCAGAAEVDITPPLGIGMFGHGPESRVATGTQLRLRCQAFVIRGPQRTIQSSTTAASGTQDEPRSLPNQVALVPCDLAAPGLLLQRTVAKHVGTRVPLAASQIMLMATHTHMAPAHYFAADSYFGPFSGRLLGFDARVLNFLARRIADAVVSAYDSSKPARLTWSQRPVLEHAIGRNRSFQAYRANHAPPAWVADRVAHNPDDAADEATDRMLAVLSIDRADEPANEATSHARRPLGVFAVFGVHPTALPNTNVAYTGDLFGYATRQVEDHIRKVTHYKAVVGIANGIEGDVMVARNATGLREAHRVGTLLANDIIERWRSAGEQDPATTSPAGPLAVAYRELSLPGAALARNSTKQPSVATDSPHLCERPELGTPSGGGASDHPTLLRAFPQYNPGVRIAEKRPCEGSKLPVIFVPGRGEPGVQIPSTVPIAVIRIGTHAIVTLPAEITTVPGIRLREAVARELNGDEAFEGSEANDGTEPRVVVVGLTNEYIQYVASEEEYDLQLYEGASTLYGPKSAEFLLSHAVCLAHFQRGNSDDRCKSGQPDVGKLQDVTYSVPKTPPVVSDSSVDCRDLRIDHSSGHCTLAGGELSKLTTDGMASYEFSFRGPPWSGFVPEDLRPHVEVCRGEAKGETPTCDHVPNARAEDERGSSVQTYYDAFTETWTALWLPELMSEKPTCGVYRIVVASGRRAVSSAPFNICQAGTP
jgi:neutral ceramidase